MNKIFVIIIAAVCGSIPVSGQTVNNGQITVSPGTKFSSVADFKNNSTANFVNDGTFFVYANFHNDGIVEYNPTQEGVTHFVGERQQNISGAVVSKLNHTLFNNHSEQPAFLLNGKVSVGGNSDFEYGIIKVEENGSFIFEAVATHSHADSDSYVDGFVERLGREEFQFPVGSYGAYHPETIGTCDWSDATFKGGYRKENSNLHYAHNQKEDNILIIDNTQYWILECNHHDTHELPLTLSISENMFGTELNNNTEVAIVGWNTETQKWKSYPTVIDTDQKLATAVTLHDGIFTLAKIEKTNDIDDQNNEIIVYNGISGNDDGKNDYFFIEGLNKFPENTLEVYNRWGGKVFDANQYGTHENWFRGYSNAKGTIDNGKKLPSGTYFYVLTYKIANGKIKKKAGYLYIN